MKIKTTANNSPNAEAILREALIDAVIKSNWDHALRVARKLPGPYRPIDLATEDPLLFVAMATLLNASAECATEVLRFTEFAERDLGDLRDDVSYARDEYFVASLGTAAAAIQNGMFGYAEVQLSACSMQVPRCLNYVEMLAIQCENLATQIGLGEQSFAESFPDVENDVNVETPQLPLTKGGIPPGPYREGIIARVIADLDSNSYKEAALRLFQAVWTNCHWPTWRSLEFYAAARPEKVHHVSISLLRGEDLDIGARNHLSWYADVSARFLKQVPSLRTARGKPFSRTQ